eukprot:TRINITY_DN44438_c0_g1_i1.p1 TRINITY_DN44438_c0_g1~~TRINITY_DN44438_c0_g1_i1.p1  ORF type:complete len:317 (+),score=42.38 TRINITY_DN44438_c0_g1_i1:36-986(+)
MGACCLPARDSRPCSRWTHIRKRWLTNRTASVGENGLNNYRFGTILGRGAFSSVFSAQDENHNEYALKVVVKSNQKSVQKQLRALSILRSVPHRSIVPLVEVVNDPLGTHIYVVLGHCNRGQAGYWDAHSRLYKQRDGGLIPMNHLRSMARDVASGLAYLQSRRVAHRDLKPENILEHKSDGRIRFQIADFGEAWQFDDSNPNGVVVESKGTYQFFPPECASGDPKGFSVFVGDVWALGVTLYGLAFGWLPFDSKDVCELFEMIELCTPRARPDGADAGLCAVLDRLLVQCPRSRMKLRELQEHPFLSDGRGSDGN